MGTFRTMVLSEYKIFEKNAQNDPLKPPQDPLNTQRDPKIMIFPFRDVVPSIPESFEKLNFCRSGFRHFRLPEGQGWSHTGARAFFGVKIFKFLKLSGMIDMISPMKKLNGEVGQLCL